MDEAPNAGEAIKKASAENALVDGLPWPEIARSRTTATAIRAMITDLRKAQGLAACVCNRTFYAADEPPDELDGKGNGAARTRLLAWTYDEVGFLSVVAADDEGRPARHA
jgi:hypothetical protein